jgi:tetratricopeptide (TPR) repeat protein
MFTLIKHSLYAFSNKFRRQRQPVELMKEKWIADFSTPEKSCFDINIKPENSYNAYLEKDTSSKEKTGSGGDALFLGLKKKNCMAWLETAHRVYADQIIKAHFRFNCPIEDYCAAGIMFRINEQGAYYLVLISNKGFFRLDAMNNNNPKPLVGWTEIPGLNRRKPSIDGGTNLGIIACGDHLIFFIDNKWIAETHDASISGGHLGFALISYETEIPDSPPELQSPVLNEGYTCRAWLDYLSVDSRDTAVEIKYKLWRDCLEISAESRLRLAESLTAIECFHAAYDQIKKAWKQREEAARSVTATYTETRTMGELLFAAQMTMRMKQYADAEDYIDICLAMDMNNLDALIEKVNLLTILNRYDDLIVFLPYYINRLETGTIQTDVSPLYDSLGHACMETGDYKAAAAAWDKAFSLNGITGLYAVNAANAYEMLGKDREALKCLLDGGKCFLQQKNYAELGPLVTKLLAVGNDNREVHILAGKWASGIGDHKRAEAELALAKKLKHKSKPVKARNSPAVATGKINNKKRTVKTRVNASTAKKTTTGQENNTPQAKNCRLKTKK